MNLDQALITKTKTEISSLKQERNQLYYGLMHGKNEKKSNEVMTRVGELDKAIRDAELALDNYMRDGYATDFLCTFAHYSPERPHSNMPIAPYYFSPQAIEERRALEERKKRKEKLYENLLVYGFLIVFLFVVIFISWKIIEFFSDTPFGTDYGEGVFMFFCLIIGFIYYFSGRR